MPESTTLSENIWSSVDNPDLKPAFKYKVNRNIRDRIIEALPPDVVRKIDTSDETKIYSMSASEHIVGRYCLSNEAIDPLFIRITERISDANLEISLTNYLKEKGASVNEFIAGGLSISDPNTGEKYRMDIRPLLLNGRHFSGKDEEIIYLGAGMVRVHQALKKYTQADVIHKNSDDRMKRLSAIAHELEKSPVQFSVDIEPYRAWIKENSDWLKDMSGSTDLFFFTDTDKSQCIHGEPHPANILFQNNDAIFLDFEEAVHLFVSTAWDLAFITQRFILLSDAPVSKKREQIGLLSESYGSDIFNTEAMKALNWITLLIIFDLWIERNRSVPLSECKKFKRLAGESERYNSTDFH